MTPESPDFGPSITAGVSTLVHTIEAGYDANDFSAADPLTVFGYSQSAVVASLAEQELAGKIPLEDLHFVLIGDAAADPASGPTGLLDTWGATPFEQELDSLLGWPNLDDVTTPTNLYPTDVFTVVNDFFRRHCHAGGLCSQPARGPVARLRRVFRARGLPGGLPKSEILTTIDTAGVVDGATTYFTLADPANLFESLWDVTLGSFGIVV